MFGKSIRINIPNEFVNEASLLTYLGISTSELKKITFYRERMYHNFWLYIYPKKERLISAPDARLKFLQRQIAEKLTELYRPRKPVHGFVQQRSVKSNALSHIDRRFVVNIDIKDFFPTISQNRVIGMLLSLGIDASVAKIISIICCKNVHLPQGAPSSPILSNMICFRLDKNLMNIAKEARCIYTRYADDITFSSHRPPTALFDTTVPVAGKFSHKLLASELRKAFEKNGFVINSKKVHYADRRSRRVVTGLKINEFVNVDRRYVRNIRAALHSIEKSGIKEAEKKFHAKYGGRSSLHDHLRGKVAFLTDIKGQADPVVRNITQRFNKCFPSSPIAVAPTRSGVRDRAVWVIEHLPKSQGTAFFLKGVGLVTAAHVVQDIEEIEVFHPSKYANRFAATVQSRDYHRDLAILRHSIPSNEYFEFYAKSEKVKIGEEVFAFGYPDFAPGDRLNIRPGVVSTHTVKSAVNLIEVTQKLTQGMSGGPVLDANDNVAGIIHKGGPQEGRDFAINIGEMTKWLDGG